MANRNMSAAAARSAENGSASGSRRRFFGFLVLSPWTIADRTSYIFLTLATTSAGFRVPLSLASA
ncbi:hypothetical protein ACCS97_37800, partial [Rhizobium ruizarguesonis]